MQFASANVREVAVKVEVKLFLGAAFAGMCATAPAARIRAFLLPTPTQISSINDTFPYLLFSFVLSTTSGSSPGNGRMTPEYKAEKEASVSFLGGGGIWEINHVALVAPVRLLVARI